MGLMGNPGLDKLSSYKLYIRMRGVRRLELIACTWEERCPRRQNTAKPRKA
jgi:hypothetical protein